MFCLQADRELEACEQVPGLLGLFSLSMLCGILRRVPALHSITVLRISGLGPVSLADWLLIVPGVFLYASATFVHRRLIARLRPLVLNWLLAPGQGPQQSTRGGTAAANSAASTEGAVRRTNRGMQQKFRCQVLSHSRCQW